MDIKDVYKNDWKQLKEIYLEAFPKAERKPFWLLKRAVKSNRARILVAKDNDIVLGFVVLFKYHNMVMVDYLAVNNKCRSRGTGSAVMRKVCELYQDHCIVLLIEDVEEDACNFEQRVARKLFYVRNGFVSSNLFIDGVSGKMEVLKRGKNITSNDFLALYKYTLGNLFFRLSKVELV